MLKKIKKNQKNKCLGVKKRVLTIDLKYFPKLCTPNLLWKVFQSLSCNTYNQILYVENILRMLIFRFNRVKYLTELLLIEKKIRHWKGRHFNNILKCQIISEQYLSTLDNKVNILVSNFWAICNAGKYYVSFSETLLKAWKKVSPSKLKTALTI